VEWSASPPDTRVRLYNAQQYPHHHQSPYPAQHIQQPTIHQPLHYHSTFQVGPQYHIPATGYPNRQLDSPFQASLADRVGSETPSQSHDDDADETLGDDDVPLDDDAESGTQANGKKKRTQTVWTEEDHRKLADFFVGEGDDGPG
jgi:hypothetical protein